LGRGILQFPLTFTPDHRSRSGDSAPEASEHRPVINQDLPPPASIWPILPDGCGHRELSAISPTTQKKSGRHVTEEGLPVETFGGLIEDLGTLVKNVIQAGKDTAERFSMLTRKHASSTKSLGPPGCEPESPRWAQSDPALSKKAKKHCLQHLALLFGLEA